MGFWAFSAITFTNDVVIYMVTSSVTTGIVASGAARAYGQQRVFHYQALLVYAPLAIALFLKFTLYYVLLSFLTVVLIVALSNIAANLNTIFMQKLLGEERANILNTQFNGAVVNIPLGLAIFRSNGRLAVMNQPFRKMTNLPPGIIHTDPSLHDIGDAFAAAGSMSIDDVKAIRVKTLSVQPASIVTVTSDKDDPQALSWTIQRMPDNGTVILVDNITERRNAEEKIAHLATHDGLTDLPNRIGFQNAVEPLLANSRDSLSAVLYIDLDHFKQVNDTLGHPVGDKLLRLVASLLRQSIREQDIAARFGGDEFAVFIRDMESPDDATVIAARIVETVGRRYEIDKAPIEIGASVGITFTRPFANYDTLLKNADLALYEAKARGRGVHCFFDPKMAEKVEARRQLEIDFKSALANSQLDLCYQPIVDLKTQRVIACEALLRWTHPIHGFVPPLEIISIARYLKMMPDLGRWITKRACAECVKWPASVGVAINVTPAGLREPVFLDDIRGELETSGLSPQRLNFEITEGALLDNSTNTKKVLADLKDLGVGVSLDDFGTGYSSLSYLHHFRRGLQKIKIDQSFINSNDMEDALTVVCSIAKLAADLGLTVVVEGIETSDQLELISACSAIDEGQGYFFGHPMAAAEIREFLNGTLAIGRATGLITPKPANDDSITETSPADPVPVAPGSPPSKRRPARQSSGQSRQRRGSDKGPGSQTP